MKKDIFIAMIVIIYIILIVFMTVKEPEKNCKYPALHESHIQLRDYNDHKRHALVEVMEDGCFKIYGDPEKCTDMIKDYLVTKSIKKPKQL